ncbi:MAG: hypothetical protein AB1606_04580 [Nitrospirota bacterium]
MDGISRGRKEQSHNSKKLVYEAELASTGTPELLGFLGRLPESVMLAIDLFLSEFDYANNKISNRAIALRMLASIVSILNRSVESVEKSV